MSSLQILLDLRQSCSQARTLSERQVLLLWRNDLIQTPSLETFYLLWKGQRDTFLILDKKRHLPIMLSGLDSSYLFCGCCRLAPARETSRLTLVCTSKSVMENSCLSTTTHFYWAIWTWSSTTSVLLHNRYEQKSFHYGQRDFWWRSNRAPSAIKFSAESSSRQVHLRRRCGLLTVRADENSPTEVETHIEIKQTLGFVQSTKHLVEVHLSKILSYV